MAKCRSCVEPENLQNLPSGSLFGPAAKDVLERMKIECRFQKVEPSTAKQTGHMAHLICHSQALCFSTHIGQDTGASSEELHSQKYWSLAATTLDQWVWIIILQGYKPMPTTYSGLRTSAISYPIRVCHSDPSR